MNDNYILLLKTVTQIRESALHMQFKVYNDESPNKQIQLTRFIQYISN